MNDGKEADAIVDSTLEIEIVSAFYKIDHLILELHPPFIQITSQFRQLILEISPVSAGGENTIPKMSR